MRAPISIEQLLATQNELMSVLVQNEAHHRAERLQHHWHQDMNVFDSDFLATHPLIFSGAKDMLEADDWLLTTESKFGSLHYTEYQKTLCRLAAERSSRGLVGNLHRSTTSISPCAMGRVSSDFMWPRLVSGHNAPQAFWVPGLEAGYRTVYDHTQEFNNLA
jgi:hypothetical protein